MRVYEEESAAAHKGKVQSSQRAASQPQAQGENPRRLGYRKPRAQAQGQGLYENNLGPLVQAQFQ